MSCSERPAAVCRQALLAMCLHAPASWAQALVLGPAYPVAEADLLQQMEEHAGAALRARPQWRAEQRDAAMRTLAQPQGIDLPRGRTPSRRRWDATVVLDEGGQDAQGRWFPAGSRFDPLRHASLTRPVLLFDARDTRQLAFATSYVAADPAAHAILTGGDPRALAAAWQRPVYFDQHGLLARRLGLQQLPALLSQQQGSLQIDEFAP